MNLGIAAWCAHAAYHHLHTGAFHLAASILGVIFFLDGAYFTGHYFVTGRRRFADFSS